MALVKRISDLELGDYEADKDRAYLPASVGEEQTFKYPLGAAEAAARAAIAQIANSGGGIKLVGVICPCGGIEFNPGFEWYYINETFSELEDPEGSPPKGAFEARRKIKEDLWDTQEYTPKDLDIWLNYNNSTYWIWQRDEWQPFDFVKYNRKIKIFSGSLNPGFTAPTEFPLSELNGNIIHPHSEHGLPTGITRRPEIGSYVVDFSQRIFGVIVEKSESSAVARTLGSFGVGGGGGDIDLSAYRTAADEDVINNAKLFRQVFDISPSGKTLSTEIGSIADITGTGTYFEDNGVLIGSLVYDANGTLGIFQAWNPNFGGIARIQTIAVNASGGGGGGGGNAALTISLNGQTNFAGNPYTPSGSPSQEIELTINPFDFNPEQNAGGIVSLYAASQSGFASNPSIGANGFTDPQGCPCFMQGNNVFYNWNDIVDPLTLAFYIHNNASGHNIYIYNVPTNEKRIFYFYGDGSEALIIFSSAALPFNYSGASFNAGLNCMAIGFLVNNVFKASQFNNLSGGQI